MTTYIATQSSQDGRLGGTVAAGPAGCLLVERGWGGGRGPKHPGGNQESGGTHVAFTCSSPCPLAQPQRAWKKDRGDYCQEFGLPGLPGQGPGIGASEGPNMFNCLNYANRADVSSRGKEEGAGHFKGEDLAPPFPSDPKAAFMGRHTGPGFPSVAWEAGHRAMPSPGSRGPVTGAHMLLTWTPLKERVLPSQLPAQAKEEAGGGYTAPSLLHRRHHR